MSNNLEPKNLPLVQNISCIFPPSEQLGGLYLGNIYGAENQIVLQQYGIRAVISLAPEKRIKYNPLKIPFFKKVQAHDDSNYKIQEDFQDCIRFIEKHRKVTNVYVHCFAGVSRSVAITAAYLMKNYKMKLNTSLEYIKHKRIVAKPNWGFMKQLKQYEYNCLKTKLKEDKQNKLAYRKQLSNPGLKNLKIQNRTQNNFISKK